MTSDKVVVLVGYQTSCSVCCCQGMNNHQVVAQELRIRYVACLNTFNSRFNGVAVVLDEDYDVAGDIDLFEEEEE